MLPVLNPSFPTRLFSDLVPPRRAPHILRDPDPFVGRGPQDVEAAELPDDAIAHRIVVAFGDEAAEHPVPDDEHPGIVGRSEEHTSELQSLMRNSYAVFCLKKKNKKNNR